MSSIWKCYFEPQLGKYLKLGDMFTIFLTGLQLITVQTRHRNIAGNGLHCPNAEQHD